MICWDEIIPHQTKACRKPGCVYQTGQGLPHEQRLASKTLCKTVYAAPASRHQAMQQHDSSKVKQQHGHSKVTQEVHVLYGVAQYSVARKLRHYI